MLVHCRVTPSINFAASRGTVRVKCLAQEHNTMFPARAPRAGDERSNHEAMHGASASSLVTFRSEVEDDYEYEFPVLSMRTSKNVGL